MMTHDQMIEVIQAHRDGKQVEYREIGKPVWLDIGPAYRWDLGFERYEFRIKPQPKKIVRYVNWYDDYGTDLCCLHATQEICDRTAANCSMKRIACVRVEMTEGKFDD